MRFCEEAALITLDGHTLVGVLAQPAQPVPLAVLVIVGGPQYRAGSHRQFVQLARTLAAAGYPTLRFDVRGMGDSDGPMPHFESISDDIGAAVDWLQTRLVTGTRVVLWGLCDAASAALLYLQARPDPRIAGLCLLNPWVRSQESQARTQVKHYYTQRLMQRQFWRKLLSGQVAASAVSSLLASVRMAWSPGPRTARPGGDSYQDRMARGWQRHAGPVLLLLSGDDYTAREFVEFTRDRAPWTALLAGQQFRRHDLPGANHTFSDPADKVRVASLTLEWLRDHVARPAETAPTQTPPR